MSRSSSSWLSLRTVKQLLFTCARVIITVLLIISSPILFFFYCFLVLYRFTVSKIAQYFDPKLGKIVSCMGNLFAAYDIYGNSWAVNIALHAVGKVDRMHVIHRIENVLESNVTPEGVSKYPELTQKVVTKFGYKFWKNLDSFQVADHVTYINPDNPDESMTLDDIRGIIEKFGKTPFDPNRSPWHVYIVKNFSSYLQPGVQSAFIFRLHHAMFDGYSILNLFSKMADNGPLVLAGPNTDQLQAKKTSRLQAVFIPLIHFFRGPYELVGQLMSYDNNELIQISNRDFKGSMRMYECEPVSLDDLKAIKNFYGVSLSTLSTTLVILSIKKFLQRKNIKNANKIHMTFPLPLPNHPDKLRNYFSGGLISFDLTIDDPIKLLHAVEAKYYQFRFAYAFGLPEATKSLLRVIGSLPAFLTPRMDKIFTSTMMYSSFPGPVDTGYFCGYPIVDATVSGSIAPAHPIGCLSYSYRGTYKICVLADVSIFTTKEEAYQLGNGIYEEFLEFSRKIKENDV